LHIVTPKVDHGEIVPDTVTLVSAREKAEDIAIDGLDDGLSSTESSIPPLATEGSSDEDIIYSRLSAAEIEAFTDETWGYGGIDYYVRKNLSPPAAEPSASSSSTTEDEKPVEARPFLHRRNLSRFTKALQRWRRGQDAVSPGSISDGTESGAVPIHTTVRSRFQGKRRRDWGMKPSSSQNVKAVDEATNIATGKKFDETPIGATTRNVQSGLKLSKHQPESQSGRRGRVHGPSNPFQISTSMVILVLFTGCSIVISISILMGQKLFPAQR